MCEHPITIRLPGCESEATAARFAARAKPVKPNLSHELIAQHARGTIAA